jgi:aminoglycoside phosphotransferase (APT) family kinase protein
MEPVNGMNPTVALPQRYVADQRWRWLLGLAMADGAAAIGAVDHLEVGLAELGKVDGYIERQANRWRSQLDSYTEYDGYPGPEIPAVDAVSKWLEDNHPTSWRPGLIHGDYSVANVMCSCVRPELAAILDWELTTLGDPLVDLGWLLATWPGPEGPMLGAASIEPWDGFPLEKDLVARYGERSDRDLSAIRWYKVLGCFKLGILLEGTYARACAGQALMHVGERFHTRTLGLFERALTTIASA